MAGTIKRFGKIEVRPENIEKLAATGAGKILASENQNNHDLEEANARADVHVPASDF